LNHRDNVAKINQYKTFPEQKNLERKITLSKWVKYKKKKNGYKNS